MTLFTLTIFVISIWSLAFYASRMLREDMQRLLGEQQLATVSILAAEVNHGLAERLTALQSVAARVSPTMLGNAATMQQLLEQRPVFQSLFNGGAWVTRLDGTVIADSAVPSERIGANFMDRDFMIAALREGQPKIGRPVMGRKLRSTIFSMAAPIRDARGGVIGALVGVTNLGRPNFLGRLVENRYGKTGGYLLIAAQHRQVVTATDKRRIMELLPAPGSNRLTDHVMQGYEGSAVLVDPLGLEMLTSTRSIPLANWYMAAQLPTDEAFAPIHDMQQRVLLATIFLTLLAGALTWWMLTRQLSPMLAAARSLSALADTGQRPQALPVTSRDEIGRLIAGFNHLLQTLAQREQTMQESEQRFRGLTAMSSDFYWESDAEHRLTARTESDREAAEAVFREASSVGKRRWEISYLSPDEAGWQQHRAMLDAHLPFRDFEISRSRVNGAEHHISVSGDPVFNASGEFTGYRGVGTDITERKRAEIDLRIAAAAFDSQESMLVTDAKTVILRVNKAFADTTGYTAEEATGQTPRLLQSDRHDAAFYRVMWETIERTGGWQGEVWNRRKNGVVYPTWLTISAVKNGAGAVTHYIGAHYDMTERKQALEKIEELAFFDALTHLPNRTLLRDRLQQAMTAGQRNRTCSAVLFIDLDHFKTLNDTLGHDKGDLLLQQVALRLGSCVREGDTVARLGGDEFVVVLENLSASPQEAATQSRAVGEKILAALNQMYRLGELDHLSTASIGATVFCGHQTAIDDVLKQADLAMYKSKDSGRNALRFFDPAMQTVVIERAALESGLRRAIQQQQFVLHYQAQVGGAGRVTGAEALVRWQHPERGMVSPAEFIPLAEETGLILPLGTWVLEAACAQLAHWALQPALADLTIAVNVSAQQFREPDFVATVLAVLRRSGANPQRLKLELTESLLVENVQDIIRKMHALKDRGVSFSLDDFGTGYSSLSYLKLLPLDQLKIDQSFVRDILIDPNDAAIAKTIVALAQSLGLGVIAEGVETQEQRDFLARSGCPAYQGYFFSRPLPVEGFEKLARRLEMPALNT